MDRLSRATALWIVVAAAIAAVQVPDPLEPIPPISMPNVRGRIDHLAVDPSGGRLFVAALGNDSVEVVDGRTGQWVRRLTGFQEPQGIAFALESGILAVANGGNGRLALLDGADYHV